MEQINNPTFIQLIVPILLAVMVFLLGIITYFFKATDSRSVKHLNTQQEINLQILENLGTLNANHSIVNSDIVDLKINDRRQDLLLEQHETKLNLIKK
jgi:hypothetical protein